MDKIDSINLERIADKLKELATRQEIEAAGLAGSVRGAEVLEDAADARRLAACLETGSLA